MFKKLRAPAHSTRNLGFETLESRRLLAVVISELGGGSSNFLSTRIRSDSSEPFAGAELTPDWLELANSSAGTVDLSGYHLTDDPADPFQWEFPAGTQLDGNGYLVVFASSENVEDASLDELGFLHTIFGLSNGGEYLALTDDLGQVVFEYAPEFAPLETGYTFGLDAAGSEAYFANPTPGALNDDSSIVLGFVADTVFSLDRGFYDAPISVEISTATPGATIVYTTDGSEPTLSNGTQVAAPNAQTAPVAMVNVATTTVLRARAYLAGYAETNVDTQTYLFLDDVIEQSATPAGFPTAWGGAPVADYEMDPEIVLDSSYTQDLISGLRELPTLSLASSIDGIFGPGGIYSNPENDTLEIAASAELIHGDGTTGFQVDAGLKVQGGASRIPNNSPKHSFSLRFRNIYGEGTLEFPLFEGSPVTTFDSLQLRAVYNNSWIHWDTNQRIRGTLIRDQWMRDTLLAMGQIDAGRGKFIHLYLDGLYWGVYMLTERPEAEHYAEYFGGDDSDYDALNGTNPVDGTFDSFQAMRTTVASGDWNAIKQVLDVDNFIDFMILQRYASNRDLKVDGNWRAAGGGPSNAPWRFYSWDAERILEGVNEGGPSPASDPAGIFDQLLTLEEFRVQFADRIQLHFFNGGALTPERTASVWQDRVDELQNAIVAESARWGDYRRDASTRNPPAFLFDRDNFWLPEVDRLLNTYFPFRSDIVLGQYRSLDLFPDLGAPVYNQHGGNVASGFQLEIEAFTTIETELVEELQAAVSAWVPTSSVNDTLIGGAPAWTLPGFDDSSWIQGTGAVGFDEQSDYDVFWGIDLLDPSLGSQGIDANNNGSYDNTSVYMRYEFQVDPNFDAESVTNFILKMNYDDGFVAYLNGTEVFKVNGPSNPVWNSASTGSHEASHSVGSFSTYSIDQYLDQLLLGQNNVLAIHGLNRGGNSSDFLISPELVYESNGPAPGSFIYYTTNGSDPRLEGGTPDLNNATLYSTPVVLNDTTTVKSRVYLNGEWSPLLVATFAVVQDFSKLAITELHYHPFNPSLDDEDDQEFIEIFNAGSQAVDLSGLQITEFASQPYVFADGLTLPAGDYLVVARNPAVFQSVYGENVAVAAAGYGTRNLSNGGETIALVSATGDEILRLTYDDQSPWPGSPDGDGPTLEIIDPLGDPNDPANWRASTADGGSPGWSGAALAGDFNDDSVVTGRDILAWLRGSSSFALSRGDLTGWEATFGQPPLEATAAVESASSYAGSVAAVSNAPLESEQLTKANLLWQLVGAEDFLSRSFVQTDDSDWLEPLPESPLAQVFGSFEQAKPISNSSVQFNSTSSSPISEDEADSADLFQHAFCQELITNRFAFLE